MPVPARVLPLFLLLACQPRSVELGSTEDGGGGGDTATTAALDARLSALEEQVSELSGQVSDLEGVVAENNQTIYSLEATVDALIEDVNALQDGGSSGGDDTGASTDAETLDALVEAVIDLQDNEPSAWSTTGSAAGEVSSWTVLATDKLEITGDGPVLAWCSAAFSGTSGQLRLVLSTETSSSSTTAITGDSVAGLFNPSAGTWTLECQGLGGPWAISTMVAIQVPNNGA